MFCLQTTISSSSNPTSPNLFTPGNYLTSNLITCPPSWYYSLSKSTGGTGPSSKPSSRNAYYSYSRAQPTTAFDTAYITSLPPSLNDPSYSRSGYRSRYSSSDDNAGPLNQSASFLYDRGRGIDNSFMLATIRSSVSPLPPSTTYFDGIILDHRNDLTSADLSDISNSSSDEEETMKASSTSLEPLEHVDSEGEYGTWSKALRTRK